MRGLNSLCLLVLVVLSGAASLTAAERPHIVIILADDVGYSDIAPFGGEIDTPHLSELAAGGLRYTQFYNTARCCPTRASLLTGLYPHQAGIGWMMEDRGYPGYRGDLHPHTPTIAEILRSAGYATCLTGKWHVTPKILPGASQHNWPLQRGFDRFYGTIHGAGSFYDPNSLTRDNTLISPAADPEYQPDIYYYTDAISDQAARFIREHDRETAEARPLFLYVAYTAAHWPMHALPEDIAKYRGRYDAGYAALRIERLARLRELGLISPDWQLTTAMDDWGDVQNREFETRCMEVYAAMLDRMDQGIGRILGALRERGFYENTLVFYLQDNGGCAEGMGRARRERVPSRPAQPTLPAMAATDLQLQMIPKQTRDGYPVRQGYGVLPGAADTYIGYGRGWANVSNTPFREFKHWVHEGGIATPLIAHWPSGISRRGELEHTPGHLVDLAATCYAVAGAQVPEQFAGRATVPLAGVSLVPSFSGAMPPRGPIYFEHEGNRAIRAGRWKLVAKEDQPWELYDMQADRTETTNLAASQPELVKELEADWNAWAARSDVLPLGAWKEKATP